MDSALDYGISLVMSEMMMKGVVERGIAIFARFMKEIEKDRDYLSISSAHFPDLSPELANRLACQDFVLDDPNITIIEKIKDVFARPDSVKEKKIRKSDVREERKEKKEGFFKRLGNRLKKKK